MDSGHQPVPTIKTVGGDRSRPGLVLLHLLRLPSTAVETLAKVRGWDRVKKSMCWGSTFQTFPNVAWSYLRLLIVVIFSNGWLQGGGAQLLDDVDDGCHLCRLVVHLPVLLARQRNTLHSTLPATHCLVVSLSSA